MDSHKMNCWEFKKCGREPGGRNAQIMGICATSTKTAVNGINGGVNGGRVCWLVSGTYAKHKAEMADCVMVKHVSSCYACDFHHKVLTDEGFTFTDDTIREKIAENKSYL